MATGHILVLEDDPAILDLLQQMLTDEGYRVKGAGDGFAGLEHLRRQVYDLILLDLMMPDMDGAEFMRILRELPLPVPPVIILSATQDATDRAGELQVAGVLPKPFNLDELLAVVAHHLAGEPPGAPEGGRYTAGAG